MIWITYGVIGGFGMGMTYRRLLHVAKNGS
jgi:hypothetical protein